MGISRRHKVQYGILVPPKNAPKNEVHTAWLVYDTFLIAIIIVPKFTHCDMRKRSSHLTSH